MNRFARTAAALTTLAAIAWSADASAAAVETRRVSNVNHSWQNIGLGETAKTGILLAQTISDNGGDAGIARINSSFQLRYQESTNDVHDLAELASVASFMGPLSDFGIPGETGTFAMSAQNRSATHRIDFQRTYVHPVVFVQAITSFGDDPIAVVPYVTTADYALIGMPEAPNYDGTHYASETVHYLVIEAGTYNLEEGSDGTAQYLEAGLVDVTTSSYSTSGMTDVTPSSVLFWDSTFAFFAQPQNGPPSYRGTRVRRTVDSDGFVSGVSARHMLDYATENAAASARPTTQGYIGYLAVGTGFPITGELTATANPLYATEVLSGVTSELTASATTLVASNVDNNCTDTDVEEKLVKSSADWGGSVFGAGYEFMAGIGSTTSTDYDFWMGAEGEADVTIFSANVNAFDGGVVSYADGSTTGSQAWVSVLGSDLYRSSVSASVTKEFSRTFLEAKGNFYGFEVAAKASGAVGFTATLSASGSKITATGKPYANIQGSISAGLGDEDIVYGGAEGTLTFIEVAVPASGSFTVLSSSPVHYAWSYDSDLTLTTLDGDISLVLSAFGEEIKSYELFSWDGYTIASKDLWSGSGCN